MIKIELDKKAITKSRKFIYLEKEATTDINSTRYTVVQASVIIKAFEEMGIEFSNNTGLAL